MHIKSFIQPLLWTSIPVGFAFLFFAPIFNHARTSIYRSTCQSHLNQMGIAYSQYVQDSDKTSPPISSNDMGWADLIQPYDKRWATFQCPAGQKTSESRRTDYFYNARLSKMKRGQMLFPTQTILFGDGTDNSGANAHLLEFPLDWKENEDSEERRHWGGYNLAFVDGHVKYVSTRNVSNEAPSADRSDWKPTFAMR